MAEESDSGGSEGKEGGETVKKEKRTYEISGDAEQLNVLERVLGRVSALASIGSSRSIKVFVDGDGAVNVRVTKDGELLPNDDYKSDETDAHFTTLENGSADCDLG
jgi:hypothetical protein